MAVKKIDTSNRDNKVDALIDQLQTKGVITAQDAQAVQAAAVAQDQVQ